MNNSKKVLISAVVLVLLLAVGGLVFALSSGRSMASAYPKLNEFRPDTITEQARLRRVEGKIPYPREYAGCYVVEGNDMMVLLKGASQAVRQEYVDFFGGAGFVAEIREAEYSLNELIDIGEDLVEKYEKAGFEVVLSGIAKSENRYTITIAAAQYEQALAHELSKGLSDLPVTLESGEAGSALKK